MKAEIEYTNPKLYKITMEKLDQELNSVLEKLLTPSTQKHEVNFTLPTDENTEKSYSGQ